MGIGRLFREKVSGADGFKFLKGDTVIVAFEGPKDSDDLMVPTKVIDYMDDCSGAYCVLVEGITEGIETPVTAITSSVCIYDPKTHNVNCNFIPSNQVNDPENMPPLFSDYSVTPLVTRLSCDIP